MSENVNLKNRADEASGKRELENDQKGVNKKSKVNNEDKEMPTENLSSPLLQLTDNCILVIFTHLTLLDAVQLGSTCSRLYGLYRDSLKDRRSLVIGWPIYKQYYDDYFEDGLPSQLLPATADYHPCMCAVYVPASRHLFASLPNLVSLEINCIVFSTRVIYNLFHYLNTLLGKLESLKLHFSSCDPGEELKELHATLASSTEDIELKLPLLKHLSLILKDHIEINYTSFFDSIFPQLTSFHLFATFNISDVLEFIDNNVRPNAQLVAAAKSGSPNLKIALMIFYDMDHFTDRVEFRMLSEEEKSSLALVTCTQFRNDINHWVQNPKLFLKKLLPLMYNLRHVMLCFYEVSDDEDEEEEEKEGDWEFTYPRMLTRLASLPHLETIELEAYEGEPPITEGKGSELCFRQPQMPVLSTVRTFLLKFSSTCHADPVEFFQLAHCFPGLKHISVTFYQSECQHCDYRGAADQDPAIFQRCGLNLARGLLRLGKTGGDITAWESAVKVKKVKFQFPKFTYNSLANLVAGTKDAY